MFKKVILFLIRKKLGLKMYEQFMFDNQKNKYDKYYFDPIGLMKVTSTGAYRNLELSNVSLNWLLNDDCGIVKD